MPRQRRFLPRAASSLQRAAEAHGRMLRDEPYPHDHAGEDEQALARPEQSQRAKAQRRDQEGQFT